MTRYNGVVWLRGFTVTVEAKDLADEIRDAFNDAGRDMNNRLNDFVFLLETEYQIHHNLDQDDWGKVGEEG